MAIHGGKTDIHWNYFLAIESDLIKLSRYVEFHKDNKSCFSVEITRILLAAASEVDVVCKQICKKLDISSKAKSIGRYHEEIIRVYPDIISFKVKILQFNLTMTPWIDWAQNSSPDWWTAYNKVKHHRHSDYAKANLKNALNAVAGLYIMVLYLYKDKAINGELVPSPQLFRPGEDHFDGTVFDGYGSGITYNL